jgi:hypothetical protein
LGSSGQPATPWGRQMSYKIDSTWPARREPIRPDRSDIYISSVQPADACACNEAAVGVRCWNDQGNTGIKDEISCLNDCLGLSWCTRCVTKKTRYQKDTTIVTRVSSLYTLCSCIFDRWTNARTKGCYQFSRESYCFADDNGWTSGAVCGRGAQSLCDINPNYKCQQICQSV